MSDISHLSSGFQACEISSPPKSRECEMIVVGHAEDLLQASFDKIVHGAGFDARLMLVALGDVLQDESEREEIKHIHKTEGRARGMEALFHYVRSMKDLTLCRRFLETIAKQNSSLFLEGRSGWNANQCFRDIVGRQLYYLAMPLKAIPEDHEVWQIVLTELQLVDDNVLLHLPGSTETWMVIALINGMTEQELRTHSITQAQDFFHYWQQSRQEPSLRDLFTSLLKLGMLALVEVLGVDVFQLVSLEVHDLISSISPLATRPSVGSGGMTTSIPPPRAGELPPNSTRLIDDDRRRQVFSAVVKKMGGGRQNIIMRALGFDMDHFEDIKSDYHGKTRALNEKLLEVWYKETEDFEPLVEHILHALREVQLGVVAETVQAIYPEAHPARSPYSDTAR